MDEALVLFFSLCFLIYFFLPFSSTSNALFPELIFFPLSLLQILFYWTRYFFYAHGTKFYFLCRLIFGGLCLLTLQPDRTFCDLSVIKTSRDKFNVGQKRQPSGYHVKISKFSFEFFPGSVGICVLHVV